MPQILINTIKRFRTCAPHNRQCQCSSQRCSRASPLSGYFHLDYARASISMDITPRRAAKAALQTDTTIRTTNTTDTWPDRASLSRTNCALLQPQQHQKQTATATAAQTMPTIPIWQAPGPFRRCCRMR